MPFIRVTDAASDYREWGYECDFVPVVGDVIDLWYGEPDADDPEDMIHGTVTRREWPLSDWDSGHDEVWLYVTLDTPIPDGMIPDSPVWPCAKHTKRKQRLKRELEEMRNRRKGCRANEPT